jgi:hypothetical protein
MKVKATIITRDRNGDPIAPGNVVGLGDQQAGFAYEIDKTGAARRVLVTEHRANGEVLFLRLGRKPKAARKAEKRRRIEQRQAALAATKRAALRAALETVNG